MYRTTIYFNTSALVSTGCYYNATVFCACMSLCVPIKKHLFELKHKEKSLGMNLKRVLVAAGEVKDGLCAPRGQTWGRSIFIKERRDAGFMGSDDVEQAFREVYNTCRELFISIPFILMACVLEVHNFALGHSVLDNSQKHTWTQAFRKQLYWAVT